MSSSFNKNQDLYNLLNNNRQANYIELKSNMEKIIDDSTDIIDNISKNDSYIKNNQKTIEKELDIINSCLDNFFAMENDLNNPAAIIYNFFEVKRSLENNYRILSLKYHQFMFQQSDSVNASLENIKNQMDMIDTRVESLGGTFLNIVLTISIVSSMVAVLINVETIYAISIVLTCTWLLLSTILFVSEYYKNDMKKGKKSFGIKIYIILSIVTLASYAPSFYSFFVREIEKRQLTSNYELVDDNQVYYIMIDDSDTINRFILDFSSSLENNAKYRIHKKYISIDNISKIIFYTYLDGDIYGYDYKIYLIDGRVMSFDIGSSDLKKWLIDNKYLND